MKSSFKPWLLLVGIFIIGVVTGSALTFGLGPRFLQPPNAHDFKRIWIMHLTRHLNLTADQQAKIEPILAEAESKIQSLHREEIGRGAQIINAADDQIAMLLTPDQKVELQKLESERQKMFSGHMRPWGGAPPGLRRHDGADDMMPPLVPPPPPPNGPVPVNPPPTNAAPTAP